MKIWKYGCYYKVLKWCHLIEHSVLYHTHLSASLKEGRAMHREVGQPTREQRRTVQEGVSTASGHSQFLVGWCWWCNPPESTTLSSKFKCLNPQIYFKILASSTIVYFRLRKVCLFLTQRYENSFFFINCEHYDSIGTNHHLGWARVWILVPYLAQETNELNLFDPHWYRMEEAFFTLEYRHLCDWDGQASNWIIKKNWSSRKEGRWDCRQAWNLLPVAPQPEACIKLSKASSRHTDILRKGRI